MLPYVAKRDFTDVIKPESSDSEIILDYIGGSSVPKRIHVRMQDNYSQKRQGKDK
jgi:hypothetical protein